MSRRLLAGALLFGAPLPGAGQSTLMVGPNIRISTSRPDVVQVEPVIAVDPTDAGRLVAAAIGLRQPFASDWQDRQTILVYYSEDGGRSWSPGDVAALPDSWTAGDPWLAWLEPGELFLSAVSGEAITYHGDPPARARLFRSEDGGRTWDKGGTTPFADSLAQDHPVLASGKAGGRVSLYVVASHAGTDKEDGIDAASIHVPDLVGHPVASLRPGVVMTNLGGAVVRSDNELVVSFFSSTPPRGLWSARLDPAKGAWIVTQIRKSILHAGFPSLAIDHSGGPFDGRIYGAWVETEDQADLRIVSAWSDDGGGSWSPPVQVHRDTSRVGRTLPVVAVAPDGAVGVVWQDRRNAGGRACSDLYGTISTDGGVTFLSEVRISGQTACAEGSENGVAAGRFSLGGGDYEGLVGVGPGAFQAVWCDSRTGRYQVWTARFELR